MAVRDWCHDRPCELLGPGKDVGRELICSEPYVEGARERDRERERKKKREKREEI